jgi:hypothetical protein
MKAFVPSALAALGITLACYGIVHAQDVAAGKTAFNKCMA